jgi:hypothetical protein
MSSISNGRTATRVATVTAGLLLSGAAFSMSPLAQGYMLGADQAGPATETKAGAKPASKGAGRFEAMDTNKDGAVTSAEAAAFHSGQFQKMDSNKDGRLSREESMAGMKSMHEGCCGGMNMMGGDGMKMMGGEGMCGGKQ